LPRPKSSRFSPSTAAHPRRAARATTRAGHDSQQSHRVCTEIQDAASHIAGGNVNMSLASQHSRRRGAKRRHARSRQSGEWITNIVEELKDSKRQDSCPSGFDGLVHWSSILNKPITINYLQQKTTSDHLMRTAK
jgi:hypothetical protein